LGLYGVQQLDLCRQRGCRGQREGQLMCARVRVAGVGSLTVSGGGGAQLTPAAPAIQHKND
jgi:hypothetical protein